MRLSEIQSSVIKEFVTKTDYVIRYLGVPEGLFSDIPQLFDSEEFVVLDLKNISTPVRPFLEILSQNKIGIDLLDKYCYSPQKQTFRSFFQKGVVDKRYDLIVDDEVTYERKNVLNTIKALICKTCKKHYIVLNSQLIKKEAITLINELEFSDITAKFSFFFDFSESSEENQEFKSFIENKNNDKNFLSIAGDENRKGHYDSVVLTSYDFKTLLKIFRNNRLFLSSSQGLSFAEWVLAHLSDFGLARYELREIYKEVGLAYFYSGYFDEATLYLNTVTEDCENDELDVAACIYMAKVFLKKKILSQVQKYAAKAIQIINGNFSSPYYALAVMLDYYSMDRNNMELSNNKYEEALLLLREAGYVCNLIQTENSVPWGMIEGSSNLDYIEAHLEEANKLASEMGNQLQVASSCHWRGLALSNAGRQNESTKYYALSNEIRTKMGDLAPLVKIRNGLSYEALNRADYIEAYNLVNTIINRIYELTDYSSIINTIKNEAFALFYSRHFDEVYPVFLLILKFLYMFDLEHKSNNSFIPTHADISAYKIYIDLCRDDFLRSKINVNNIFNSNEKINLIDRPILMLDQAVIELNDRNYDKAVQYIEDGLKIYDTVKSFQKHRVVFILYEFAYFLKKFEYFDEAEEFFERGFKIAKENKFAYYSKKKDSLTVDEYIKGVETFEPLGFDLKTLEDKAEKERLMNQLHGRLQQYQFLNRIMSLSSDTSSITSYIYHVAQNILDYTLADSIFVVERTETEWKTLSAISNIDGVKVTDQQWEELFTRYQKNNSANLFYDEQTGCYFSNLSKYEVKGALCIMPNSKFIFSSDTIDILNIALSSVQAQLVMLKQDEHLLYISNTDLLSLLKNRRALQEHISSESERLRRFNAKKRLDLQESIAFIDLDNFKYYNDTYGHEAGDLFITCFAKLLKQVYRQVDFLARFGGDEFVVVLPDTSCDEAKIAANRLYAALQKCNHFLPDLETFLDRKIDIPENRLLGFSMGICSNFDVEDKYDLSKVMMNADQALYFSKEHGKGRYSNWTEIKDQIKKEEG